MTWCDAAFEEFNRRIKLDNTRWSRIDSAHTHLREFAFGDEALSQVIGGDIFLQGSVPSGTVIKPCKSDDFDVDIVVPLDMTKLSGSEPVFDWFATRFLNDAFYKENIERKERCIRINYKDDFHLDVIPATRSFPAIQPLAVPAKELNMWIESDPDGFKNWVMRKGERSGESPHSGYFFQRGVRMCKRLRDERIPIAYQPSSILFTAMLDITNHQILILRH